MAKSTISAIIKHKYVLAENVKDTNVLSKTLFSFVNDKQLAIDSVNEDVTSRCYKMLREKYIKICETLA